jgi:hypothetical protein
MNHSLLTADRTTHLKIVVVALVAAVVVVAVGVTARITETGTATARMDAPVMKAGKPSIVTSRDDAAIR